MTDCLTHIADMQTLSRMTGKDFSGPTPVIKAPTPPQLPGGEASIGSDGREGGNLDMVQKSSPSTAVEDGGEEIIGNIEDD